MWNIVISNIIALNCVSVNKFSEKHTIFMIKVGKYLKVTNCNFCISYKNDVEIYATTVE